MLDNCEHLLDACREVVEGVLRSCPRVTVLSTSRASLEVTGEITWRVPSLSLPGEPHSEPVGTAKTMETVTQSEAVRLFIDRARQVRPNFSVNEANAPAIAQICHDLDGIPLAIELAAARVRMMAPEQIAAGLDESFRLLTGGARSALPRQQTLRASVDWSHELLDERERMLFRRLAVFAGGWTLDAVEQICAGEGLERLEINAVDPSSTQALLAPGLDHILESPTGLESRRPLARREDGIYTGSPERPDMGGEEEERNEEEEEEETTRHPIGIGHRGRCLERRRALDASAGPWYAGVVAGPTMDRSTD